MLALVLALAVFAFLFIYQWDNKYTMQGPKAQRGVLELDEQALDEYPLLFLVNGWEYYGGRLLGPDDFLEGPPAPDRYIYIGQYGGFEANGPGASPHGSATYRLNIRVPDQPRDYMLELPEIFSAYRAYVNGEPVMQLGDPDPADYRAETGNRAVAFEAGENIEIIIAASDFSHLYSGMTFPPAFGEPDMVTGLLEGRLVLRTLVCAVALTIALVSILVGILSRNKSLALLYGFLCLCFVGYVSYPVLETFVSGFQPLYVIENISFCAMLLLVMWVQHKAWGGRWSRYFLWFGVCVCALAAVLPLFWPGGSLGLMYGYSYLISAYEWITAGFITVTAVRAVWGGHIPAKALLCGIAVFDCALVMDRLLPLHEPVYTGWFIEVASFVLVVSMGIVIGQEVAGQFRENAVLTERAKSMERLSEMQRGYFSVLRRQVNETKVIRHDMRHHFMVIGGLLEDREYDRLAAYVSEYRGATSGNEAELYSDNNVINILLYHYNALAGQQGVLFDARCEPVAQVRPSDGDLCSVLSNLLENAVEACARAKEGKRFIRLAVTALGDDLVIRMENSTDGAVRPQGTTFSSSREEGREGYGLRSVRAIAARYGGSAQFGWDADKQVFTSLIIL